MYLDVAQIGVHPANRDGAGLVPADVHNLLKIICHVGWMMQRVDALACPIPDDDEGESWRQFNATLAADSLGLLPRVEATSLTHVTARGSHTTAAVRLYKIGARGTHPALCSDDMRISQTKTIGQRPSMRQPLEKGIPYKVIRLSLIHI